MYQRESYIRFLRTEFSSKISEEKERASNKCQKINARQYFRTTRSVDGSLIRSRIDHVLYMTNRFYE